MKRDPVRRWKKRRPLALAAACMVLGMIAAVVSELPWALWALGGVLILVLALISRRFVLAFLAILLGSAAWMSIHLIKPDVQPARGAELCGTLAEAPAVREENTRLLLENVQVNGESAPCRVMVYLYGDAPAPLEYGSTVSMRANVRVPTGPGNPHGFDYAAWLWRHGAALTATASADELTITSPASISLKGTLLHCRARLRETLRALYDDETAPVVTALLLGEDDMMPESLREGFRRAGLMHILAISGMHVGCLALALEFLLRALRCPKNISFALTMVLLSFYAALIGFPASVMRAILMYAFVGVARLLGRPSDSLSALSLALMVLLLFHPLSLMDTSLILSFSAMGGIVLLRKAFTLFPKRHLPAPLRNALTLLSVTWSAQIGVMPAMACFFSTMSTYTVLLGLPVLPLVTMILPVAMLSMILGVIAPWAAWPLAWCVQTAMKGLIALIEAVARLPGTLKSVPAWPWMLIALFAMLCFLCAFSVGVKRRVYQAALLLTPLIALALPLLGNQEGLEILFLDVGQADGALIRAEDRYYLVDVGEDDTVANYLSSSGVTPDGIFLSHPHQDHAGGLPEIVQCCAPGIIYLPCLWDEANADEGVPEALMAAQEAGWRVEIVQVGDVISLSDDVHAEVIQPWLDMTDDANGASLVLRVCYGEGSALFTGDLIIEDEQAFFPDCDVLKVAHHGSSTSTSELFLDMVTPSVAVISVGRGNSYGHPTQEVLDRLAGAAIYRTDQCGAIDVIVREDGAVEVSTYRQPDTEGEAA